MKTALLQIAVVCLFGGFCHTETAEIYPVRLPLRRSFATFFVSRSLFPFSFWLQKLRLVLGIFIREQSRWRQFSTPRGLLQNLL